MTYPNKKDAVAFVVDYVQNPSKAKAICMPQKLKRFGVMPSQKGNITPAELEKVAGWMFDNYPTANFRGHGRGMKSAGGMQRGSMFAMIDTNNDGKITPDEFSTFQKSRMGGMRKSGMRTMQNRTIFPDMDLNKDGVITKDEFLKVREAKQAQRASQGMPMRNASKAPSFESIDSNGDGKITPDEFNKVVKFGQKNLSN
jgi:Ca2+-binding EF-hand superfamily protein